MDLELAVLKIGVCALFGLVSIRFNILDAGGTLVAVSIGFILIFIGGFSWFGLLMVFLFFGMVVTHFRFGYKERRGVHERGNGKRRKHNVFANGMVPAILAVLTLSFSLDKIAVPFAVAIAVAASDTFASEIGVLSDDVYLITTFRRVEVGTNGGISWLGEGAALVGTAVIAVSAVLLLELDLLWALFVTILGFVGCQIDSLLGATLQGGEKGREGQLPADAILTNSDVNLLSIAIAALSAFIVAVLVF